MSRKKISTTVYVEVDQDVALKQIRDRTGIPMAVLIRDAIDVALARWADSAEDVLSRVEETLDTVKEQAEAEARHLGPLETELEILVSHARQLQLERDQAQRISEHYRSVLRGVQNSLSEALSASAGLRQAVGVES